MNIKWRGKTYCGAFIDIEKHSWQPPRFVVMIFFSTCINNMTGYTQYLDTNFSHLIGAGLQIRGQHWGGGDRHILVILILGGGG